METIIFKVPDGTKAKLKSIHQNISAVLREQTEILISKRASGNAHAKARHLICDGPGTLSTGRDYLKQYDPQAHH